MTSLTLLIPETLKNRMHDFKFINWSEVARSAIAEKIHLLRKIDRLLSKSTLTEEESVKYGRMIKKRQWSETKKLIS